MKPSLAGGSFARIRPGLVCGLAVVLMTLSASMLYIRQPVVNFAEVITSRTFHDFPAFSVSVDSSPQRGMSRRGHVTCAPHSTNSNHLPACVPCLEGFDKVQDDRPFENKSYNQYFNSRPEVVQELITRYLIEPSFECPYLLALQPSTSDMLKQRDIVRNTWGSVARSQTWPNGVVNAPVRILFVTANSGSAIAHRRGLAAIENEADRFHDILHLDMADSYRNLTLKLLSALKWVKENCPCVKFVLKVDYDTFVNVPVLVNTLLYHQSHFLLAVIGRADHVGRVYRRGRWAVDRTLYPMDKYPLYAAGCGYVMSFEAMSKIVEAVSHFRLFDVEDAFITGVMRRVIHCPLFRHKCFLEQVKDTKTLCRLANNELILGIRHNADIHPVIWQAVVQDTWCGSTLSQNSPAFRGINNSLWSLLNNNGT